MEKGASSGEIASLFKERRELSIWVLAGRDSGLARGDREPSAL